MSLTPEDEQGQFDVTLDSFLIEQSAIEQFNRTVTLLERAGVELVKDELPFSRRGLFDVFDNATSPLLELTNVPANTYEFHLHIFHDHFTDAGRPDAGTAQATD